MPTHTSRFVKVTLYRRHTGACKLPRLVLDKCSCPLGVEAFPNGQRKRLSLHHADLERGKKQQIQMEKDGTLYAEKPKPPKPHPDFRHPLEISWDVTECGECNEYRMVLFRRNQESEHFVGAKYSGGKIRQEWRIVTTDGSTRMDLFSGDVAIDLVNGSIVRVIFVGNVRELCSSCSGRKTRLHQRPYRWEVCDSCQGTGKCWSNFEVMRWSDVDFYERCRAALNRLRIKEDKPAHVMLFGDSALPLFSPPSPEQRAEISERIRLQQEKKHVGLTRAKADEIISALTERAKLINKDPQFLFGVRRIAIFGSYLTEKQKLGDLDVAVSWARKHKDPKEHRRLCDIQRNQEGPGDFFGSLAWPETKVRRALRGRNRAISIHAYEELEQMTKDGMAQKQEIFYAPEFDSKPEDFGT